MQYIWVIQSSENLNIVGCFNTREQAENFINKHQLKVLLTKYPINISVYDWVISNDYWEPKNDLQKTSKFISKFNSAYLEHEHYNSNHES